MSTIDARAADLAIRGTVGDDLSITVTVVDSNGDPIDLSGYTTIQADVLRNGTSVATFTDSLGGAGDNVITLTLTDVQTAAIGNERGLTWSLEVDADGSSVTQWLAGEFRLYTQGTPGASGSTSVTLTATGAVTLTVTTVAPLATLDGRYRLLASPSTRGDAVAIIDSFDRTDSTLTLGTTDTGQAWTNDTGVWGISSNKAYPVTSAAEARATFDSGVSDFILEADFTTGTARWSSGFVIRGADANNFLLVYLFKNTDGSQNTITLFKCSAGSYTTLRERTSAALTAATTYPVRIEAIDNWISVAVGHFLQIGWRLSSADQTAYGSNTRIGVRAVRGATTTSDDGASRIDSLRIITP